MKEVKKKQKHTARNVLIILSIIFLTIFVVIPILAIFAASGSESQFGNVAKIPIEGAIFSSGKSSFSQSVTTSTDIIRHIEKANKNPSVKVIVLEINSPGGSAVASDEIGAAIKRSKKPIISHIREVGASGGYWIASATDHIIIHRMGITGSIGVISSYLEFSGLMEEYGVDYQRLVAGEYKDMGTPLKKLTSAERNILQAKLDRIHQFFIEEVAQNRDLPQQSVEKIATGEFFLGVEALELGLVDQLGDAKTVEEYLKETYDLEEVSYITYQTQPSFFDLFGVSLENIWHSIGEGIGSILVQQENPLQNGIVI